MSDLVMSELIGNLRVYHPDERKALWPALGSLSFWFMRRRLISLINTVPCQKIGNQMNLLMKSKADRYLSYTNGGDLKPIGLILLDFFLLLGLGSTHWTAIVCLNMGQQWPQQLWTICSGDKRSWVSGYTQAQRSAQAKKLMTQILTSLCITMSSRYFSRSTSLCAACLKKISTLPCAYQDAFSKLVLIQ